MKCQDIHCLPKVMATSLRLLWLFCIGRSDNVSADSNQLR